jgi:hypothetical protein
LPEPIISYIKSPKIRISEDNGNVILSPIKNPNVDELFGMFNDGKLSSDDFIKQKIIEKEIAVAECIIGKGTLVTSDHADFEKMKNAEKVKINWFR